MSTRDTKKAAKWMAAQYVRFGDPETTVADCQFMFEEDLDLMHREGVRRGQGNKEYMKGNLGHTALGVAAPLTIHGDIGRLLGHDELADKREEFWRELLPRLHRNLARRRLMRCKPVRVARFIGAFLGTIQRGGADSMR